MTLCLVSIIPLPFCRSRFAVPVSRCGFLTSVTVTVAAAAALTYQRNLMMEVSLPCVLAMDRWKKLLLLMMSRRRQNKRRKRRICRAMHYSAKRGIVIAVVCNAGGSGPHRLDISENNCTFNYPNTFGEILGRVEVGWGKVACWSTKAAISLKRVNIEESCKSYTIGSYQRNALSNGTIPTPHPFLDWKFATPARNSNRYYLRNG